jgi:hypothetical protein
MSQPFDSRRPSFPPPPPSWSLPPPPVPAPPPSRELAAPFHHQKRTTNKDRGADENAAPVGKRLRPVEKTEVGWGPFDEEYLFPDPHSLAHAAS